MVSDGAPPLLKFVDEFVFAGGALLSQPPRKNMVNDGVAPRLEITFHMVHSYRVHSNRSKLEISALFSLENWENKFGSTNSHFFLGWTLYAHKLHAPCSQAPCSCLHASVVGLRSSMVFCFCPRNDFNYSITPPKVNIPFVTWNNKVHSFTMEIICQFR